MEGSQFTKDEDPLLVKDLMTSAVQLEANTTASDALQALDQKNVEYGVVIDGRDKLYVIVTREQLRGVNVDAPIRGLTTNVPHPEFIEPYETLDSIVEERVKDFLIKQDLIGIVVQELGNVVGILLRNLIIEYASSMLNTRRLPGPALRGLLFKCLKCPGHRKCPDGPEQIRLTFYDPDNPPKCSQGRQMERV